MFEEFIFTELTKSFPKYKIELAQNTNTVKVKSLKTEAEIYGSISENGDRVIVCVIYSMSRENYKTCSHHRSLVDLIHYLTYEMVVI